MGDTYMNTKSAGDYGTDTPNQSAQSSQLYKALLQQSMQQPQGTGLGGIFAKMLGTFGQQGEFGQLFRGNQTSG